MTGNDLPSQDLPSRSKARRRMDHLGDATQGASPETHAGSSPDRNLAAANPNGMVRIVESGIAWATIR